MMNCTNRSSGKERVVSFRLSSNRSSHPRKKRIHEAQDMPLAASLIAARTRGGKGGGRTEIYREQFEAPNFALQHSTQAPHLLAAVSNHQQEPREDNNKTERELAERVDRERQAERSKRELSGELNRKRTKTQVDRALLRSTPRNPHI